MLNHLSVENLLFLDIETVPAVSTYHTLPEKLQKLWDKKAAFIGDEGQSPEELYGRAGIYAEFGKIVCVSVGFVFSKNGLRKARIKSFAGHDEREILSGFSALLENFGTQGNFTLCAHNGREFDFPFLARRMLINGLTLPDILDIAGKKPWEVRFADTMELWKFGDYKNHTSLELLTAVFDIPTPKDDIDGSMVSEVYYKDQDVSRIMVYCEKDVLAIIQLFLKYKGQELIPEENVEYVK